MALYKKIPAKFPSELNPAIYQRFLNIYKRPDVRKTHLFEDRYENIYLDEQHIPQLQPLITEAVSLATDIISNRELTLSSDTPAADEQLQGLRAGYWFNYMPPGSVTTLHTHDDYDELLSGVYYVRVPEDSGNLIIHHASEKIVISPTTGDFIFFNPDTRHEVTRNNSRQHRLSIGINFGVTS